VLVRDAIRRQREDRWPPPQPISQEGRIAGLTTTGCVIASAVAWLVVSFQVSQCTQHCSVEPGVGGLVALLVSVVLVAAIGLAWTILVRPTDPEGGLGWVFGLSVIFAVGVLAAASGIPSLTCPHGTKLSFFGFCAGPHGARLDAARWAWLRRLIDVAGVLLAFTLIRSRRWVAVTASVAGVVWLAGTGALLVRTLAEG
jgi:hypothetical protein